jgi:alpha-tubulin suppressor-like RCC1 family protein
MTARFRARLSLVLLTLTLTACTGLEDEPLLSEDPSEYPVEPPEATSSVVAACSGTSGQWSGCRGHGCAVCSETTQRYPYYFVNHPLCDKNLTCEGSFSTCNANCPAPSNADKEPSAGQCNGTSGQWSGCRGNGCAVCSEKLTAYPFYFTNHPKCVRNDTCAGVFATCNSNCPAPAETDKAPLAGTCNGSPGQWAGCRGTGCSVCAEKLGAFPNYFKNHPNCVKNTTCAGVFATCNSNCPAPTDADRAPAAPMCDGTSGQWAGCRGTGCAVCSELTQKYPYYFGNHPLCDKNLTCDGSSSTCNANCAAPTDADKVPAAGTCGGTAGLWAGCRGNGCAVCSEKLTDYPFYFHHHPRCVRNDSCGGNFYTCNENCPPPVAADKLPPAGTCNGTSGQWAGCRGTGCSVCAEKLTAYPNYFKNHPNCVKNTTCAGSFSTCNSNCPAPTDADKSSPSTDPFATTPAYCPSTGELVVSADNLWDVYSDGVRLKPTDTANLETDWHKPARYKLSLTGGRHILAIHAADSAGGKSGLIADVKLRGQALGGALTETSTDWRVLPAGQTPPADWKTAVSLAWLRPPVASTTCQNLWANDTTFTAAWKTATGGASPRAWVWNKVCDSAQSGWQKDNWYRLVVDVRCDSGSTTCPDGTACPFRDANGVTKDIGVCKNGVCAKTTCDDLGARVDANGNVLLPPSISDLANMADVQNQTVDEDVGAVATTDGPESVGQCEAAVGQETPPTVQADLTKAAQESGTAPLTEFGISLTGKEVAGVIQTLSDPTTAEYTRLLDLGRRPNPAWNTIVTASTTAPAYVEPPVCDTERDTAGPFAGRDIIFVHGYDPDVLLAKHIGHAAEPARTWAGNREDFYSGYYKNKAESYWNQHIKRYLRIPGHKNRYMTVAWSTNERLDVAVDAMLTQVNDAMKSGRGVITTPGDLRGQRGFCVPSCIILSHSTGAPLTDISMAVAKDTPGLKFIPEHVKTHVSFEGAFAGSPTAVVAMALSAGVRGAGLAASLEGLCTLVLRLFGSSASCPETTPDFFDTVTVDLVPAVAETVWKPYLERTPVPTLTVTGGHATSAAVVTKLLYPGFDDDTLTSNSTCANPNPWWAGPSGFKPSNPFALFDLGLIRFTSNPFEAWKTAFSAVRPLGYWLDQVVDPVLWGRSSYASAGCTAQLSPTGMLQPVVQELGDYRNPRNRLTNHFSFIQTAAAHSIASIEDEGRDYKKALGWRSYEETRVITNDAVYTMTGNDLRSRDGRDKAPIVGGAMKTLQRERVKGWQFAIGFGSFKKRFWIWKRRYHQLDKTGEKDQGDYVYENVATTGPTPVVQSLAACGARQTVAAGWYHTCVAKGDGSVRCWGENTSGQLGNNSTMPSMSPVSVVGLDHATVVTAGANHSCALRRDGNAWCWGKNYDGTLGNGTYTDSSVPVRVADLSDAIGISAGNTHTCALSRSGRVWCWGYKGGGALGNGELPTGISAIANKPVLVLNVTDAVAVTVGYSHSCAVTRSGSVWCWGANNYGQVGSPDLQTDFPVPVKVPGLADARSIEAGSSFTCAGRADGTTSCWGVNQGGQLGNNSFVDSPTPVQVIGLSNNTLNVAAGASNACTLGNNGAVWCWGMNGWGQVGNGGATDTNFPTAQSVSTISGIDSLSSYYLHTCAMNPTGQVWCWGDNLNGRLGTGSTSPRVSNVPVAVVGL